MKTELCQNYNKNASICDQNYEENLVKSIRGRKINKFGVKNAYQNYDDDISMGLTMNHSYLTKIRKEIGAN